MKPKYFAIGTGLCLLLAASLLVVIPREVNALPANETEVWWIDGNGNEVGHYVRDCSGAHFMEGVQSNRKITHSESCQTSFGSTGCYLNGSQVSCSNPEFYETCVALYGSMACE